MIYFACCGSLQWGEEEDEEAAEWEEEEEVLEEDINTVLVLVERWRWQ